MAETIEGGAYRAGEKWVDANGKEIKAPSKAALKKSRGGAGAVVEDDEEEGKVSPIEGISFASEAAGKAAVEGKLTAESFAGATGTGAGGAFNAADVKKLIEAANPPA
jgi:hypothetical protein